MVYKFFDKKSSSGFATCGRSETLATQNKSAIKVNFYQTSNKLKNYTIQFEKQKVYSSLKTMFTVLI